MSQARFGWLVSYPKSGNTWVRLLLEGLLNGGKPLDLSALELSTPIATPVEFDELFGIESSLLTARELEAVRPAFFRLLADNFDGPLILRKVHDRCWRAWTGERVFPPCLSRGAVYIVRDPRDVAISMTSHYGIGIEDAIDRLKNPDWTLASTHSGYRSQFPQPVGTWSEHVTSWLDESEMPVHVVRYEDLHADAEAALSGIAAFLGIPAAFAREAVQAAKFERLQAQEAERGFSEKPRGAERFFREGRAGGWRSALSPSQASRIEKTHGTLMARLGYI